MSGWDAERYETLIITRGKKKKYKIVIAMDRNSTVVFQKTFYKYSFHYIISNVPFKNTCILTIFL